MAERKQHVAKRTKNRRIGDVNQHRRPAAPRRMRVVVSESRPVVIRGLEGIMQAVPEISVVATTSSGYELMRVARTRRPDIALVATNLADVETLHVLSDIHDCVPSIMPIVLTETAARASWQRFKQDGACAVIRTSVSPLTLIRCIEKVYDDGEFWDNERTAEPRAGGLTDREGDVLYCLASGHDDDHIAAELSISVHTVRNHIQNIYRKTDLHCQRALVAWAWKNGFGGTSL